MDYGRNWCKNSIWYKIHKYLVGNTTVNASYVGDDKYAASYKIINIEVTIINTNLTVEPDSLDLTVGDNVKLMLHSFLVMQVLYHLNPVMIIL